ncbi:MULTISPECIES: response regulator [unclassified Colwellia]|uniref:response regulator n=1 Tax=unclassified Colwellia TaxID=196834 RepID=UPI0015F4CEA1|nr:MULTISPECIES: response regulator [unclassified Colwellia]MBA6224026.1 response regulator [Colwellia sp. MB3u-45]MBA6266511.1 response regulator [Colwellia sp. MB3u-43]MBA6289507.1 response regulator [Colwellia sp. MB3u-4]MBA6296694.1 response regulator [Colwellia sp. MB02u-9]MBA6320207.1 response regulator [Colwellia sp. MB02u-19]
MHQVTDLKVKHCTSKQAASLLEVTTRTIQLWSDSGILKAWKTVGGHRRFNLEDIEALKAELKQETNPAVEHKLVRVLVIEDEPDLIMLYKMTIEGWNLPIILQTASDGFQGLIHIGAWKPDIVITDIQMPNVNGIHMLKSLAKMEEFNDMVVMAVSGLSKAEITQKGGLPAGIPIFTKPIPFDEIEKIINQQCKTLLSS